MRRLDLLRKMVPHTERSNTACFLEEVLKYIDALKSRVVELESTLQAIQSGKNGPSPLMSGTSAAPAVRSGRPDQPMNDRMAMQQHQLQQLQMLQHQQGGSSQQHALALQQHALAVQQQQLQLQQQHEAALAVLREEQQRKQFQHASSTPLPHQPENGDGAQGQSADLASILGLRSVAATGQPVEVNKSDGQVEGSSPGRQHGADPSTPSTSLHLPPVPQLQLPASALDALAAAAAANGSEAAVPPAVDVKPSMGGEHTEGGSKPSSPTNSQEGDVPLKKRKVLML